MSVFQLCGYFSILYSKKRKETKKTTKTVHSTSMQTHYSFTLNLCFTSQFESNYIGTVIKSMNHVWSTSFLVIHNSTLTRRQSNSGRPNKMATIQLLPLFQEFATVEPRAAKHQNVVVSCQWKQRQKIAAHRELLLLRLLNFIRSLRHLNIAANCSQTAARKLHT